jgi:hypothetical protein
LRTGARFRSGCGVNNGCSYIRYFRPSSCSGTPHEANGEDNKDGTSDNRSWNCGVEGPTDAAEINALREHAVSSGEKYGVTATSLLLFALTERVAFVG